MKKICLAIILVGICCLPILKQTTHSDEVTIVDSDSDGSFFDDVSHESPEKWTNVVFYPDSDTDCEEVSWLPCADKTLTVTYNGFTLDVQTKNGLYVFDLFAFGDWDDDNVLNREDNCPSHPNPNQLDSDMNGVGNVCEPPVFKKTTGSQNEKKPQPEPKPQPDPQPNKWAHFSNEGDKLRRLIQLAGNSKS